MATQWSSPGRHGWMWKLIVWPRARQLTHTFGQHFSSFQEILGAAMLELHIVQQLDSTLWMQTNGKDASAYWMKWCNLQAHQLQNIDWPSLGCAMRSIPLGWHGGHLSTCPAIFHMGRTWWDGISNQLINVHNAANQRRINPILLNANRKQQQQSGMEPWKISRNRWRQSSWTHNWSKYL